MSKPAIRIVTNGEASYMESVKVFSGDTSLGDYTDISYEQSDALAICILLGRMERAGIITIEADEKVSESYARQLKGIGY